MLTIKYFIEKKKKTLNVSIKTSRIWNNLTVYLFFNIEIQDIFKYSVLLQM